MSPAVPLPHHCAAISFLPELFLAQNSIQWGLRPPGARHSINTEQGTASVTGRLQIVTSPEQEPIPHWSQRHSAWAQQPGCRLNNTAERGKGKKRQWADVSWF